MNRAQVAPLLAAAAVGALLGFGCARLVLVGSGLSLVPWAVAGVAIGFLTGSARAALLRGAVYGFVLAYLFMLAGYDGSAALDSRLAPFLVFGAVGAVCGALLAGAGFALRGAIRRR